MYLTGWRRSFVAGFYDCYNEFLIKKKSEECHILREGLLCGAGWRGESARVRG